MVVGDKQIQEVEVPASTEEGGTQTQEPQPKEAPQENPLSRQLAMVARKDAEYRRKMQELEAREAQYKERAAKLEELQGFKKSFEEDFVRALDTHVGEGWYEKATNRFVNDPSGKITPDERVSALEKQLEEERANKDKWLSEKLAEIRKQENAQLQEIMQDQRMRGDIKKLVEEDERFELTRSDPDNLVIVHEVMQFWKKNYGEELPIEDAAVMVEEDLEKKVQKLFGAKKLSEMLKNNVTPGDIKPETKAPRAKEAGQMKTLTNKMSAASAPPPSGRLSEEERLAAAIDAFRSAR